MRLKKLYRRLIENYYRIFNIKKIQENSFIELELSNICNADCIFCTYGVIKKSNKNFKIMDEETFEKIIEKIKKQSYKRISFTPTTGEILVNNHWDIYIKKVFELENIESILFYSNAILLDEKNIDKLICLLKNKKNKISDIHFSIGGIDSKTYKFMYGVDKYNQVKININSLLKKLKEFNLKTDILLELRIPKDIFITEEDILKEFNICQYKNFKINILKEFIKISCVKEEERLKYLEPNKNQKIPCGWLYKTRYDVNGNIWADGCVVSEIPNNLELKLGSLDDTLKVIEKRRDRIIKDWKKGKIPEVCKGCQSYREYKYGS